MTRIVRLTMRPQLVFDPRRSWGPARDMSCLCVSRPLSMARLKSSLACNSTVCPFVVVVVVVVAVAVLVVVVVAVVVDGDDDG